MSRSLGLTLGTLEIAVLECLWRLGEADAKRVHAEIGIGRGVTLNTIQSTLDRLYRKTFLDRRKVSHAFVYTPLDRSEFVGRAIGAVLDQLASGETGAALTAFVDFAARTAPETLRELERRVAERIDAARQQD
jgi:predicted transcriptional regulator